MSFPNCYDGGSVEIGPSSPPNSVNSDCHEDSEDAEYVYVKYRIANKRLSSMEEQITELRATIDTYAIALQNETQIREMWQLALLDEQIRHSECRAAYLRLLQFLYSQPQRSDEDTTAYKSQKEHLLTVIENLQTKIQTLREQCSGALHVAADHIVRTERALEQLQMACPAERNPVTNEEDGGWEARYPEETMLVFKKIWNS